MAGEPRAAILSEELQEQEFILNQCAEQLEISELTHAALLSHLKEALAEQESKLEIIRSQLQIVRIKAERSAILRRQLSPSGNVLTGNTLDHGPQETGVNVPGDTSALQKALSSGDATLSWSMSTFTSDQATLEEEVKDPRTAAAEIAAKLAASASSAQMLQSVLSSFVAEASLVSRVESAPLEQPTHLTPDKQQKLIGQDDNMTKDDGNHSNVKYSVPMFPLSNIGIPQQADSGHAPASLITSTVTSLNPPSHPILLSHPQYRGHDAIIHVQGYGYGSTSVSTLPSFSSIQQQQIVMAVTPSSSISSHNSNRIELKSIQQSVHGYFSPVRTKP
ncbi:hypothetical protein KP509_14G013600 [Ceratopteris richardii]|uniref:Uncharacterized protein n=1 Tax=Ceratopteris richardii TaxID=49495 RepID=A0A8T2T778_CERRI|nr:hypothetical protein KP509_14G013600 [Ceratopteris richardii]